VKSWNFDNTSSPTSEFLAQSCDSFNQYGMLSILLDTSIYTWRKCAMAIFLLGPLGKITAFHSLKGRERSDEGKE